MKRKRDYKLEAAMFQRIVAALTARAPGQYLSVSNEEVGQADQLPFQARQTAQGMEFRIASEPASRIISLH